MRNFSIVLLLLLTSCGSYQIKRREGIVADALKSESYLRWNNQKLAILAKSKNKVEKALAKCHGGQVPKGLVILKRSLNGNETMASYWNALGTCYYLGHRLPKAIYFYQMALTRPSGGQTKAMISNNMGLVHMKLRNYVEAKKSFKQAITHNPSALTPKFNLAQLQIKFGLLRSAKQYLENILNVDQKDPDILASLGTIALFENNLTLAEKYFNKIDVRGQKREDIAYHYALVLFHLGKLNNAKSILKDQNNTFIMSLRVPSKHLMGLIVERMKEIETRKKYRTPSNKKVKGS